MRCRLLMLLAVGAPLTASGCNLAYYTGHNLINEPITLADETKFTHRLKSEARVVWTEICRQFPARTFSPEFADGFTDGYVDHLENGGPTGPPVVPPLRYRRANYLTVEGHALVRDYLIGFQYGTEVANATGKRNFLTVPVLVQDPPANEPLNVISYPTPPAASRDQPAGTPLPTPRPTTTTLDATVPAVPNLGNPIPVRPDDLRPLPEPKPAEPLGTPPPINPATVNPNSVPTPIPSPVPAPTPGNTIPDLEPRKPPQSSLPVPLPSTNNLPMPVIPTLPERPAAPVPSSGPRVDPAAIPSPNLPTPNLPTPARPASNPKPSSGDAMPIVDPSFLPSGASVPAEAPPRLQPGEPVNPNHMPPPPRPPAPIPPAR